MKKIFILILSALSILVLSACNGYLSDSLASEVSKSSETSDISADSSSMSTCCNMPSDYSENREPILETAVLYGQGGFKSPIGDKGGATAGDKTELFYLNDTLLSLDEKDISVIYVSSAPVETEKSRTLTQEEAFALVKLIKENLMGKASLMENLGNPWTGGGFRIYIKTPFNEFIISHNGGWLTFEYPESKAPLVFSEENGFVSINDYISSLYK